MVGTGIHHLRNIWQDRVVVCVSHDRTFLEDAGDVLHISGHCRRLTQTHGDYATWRARRAEKLITWQRQQKKQEAEVEKLKEYAGHGFRYGGSSIPNQQDEDEGEASR